MAPFWLTPTAQPGESSRFHSANSLSTLALDDRTLERLQAVKDTSKATASKTDNAMTGLFIGSWLIRTFTDGFRTRHRKRILLSFVEKGLQVRIWIDNRCLIHRQAACVRCRTVVAVDLTIQHAE